MGLPRVQRALTELYGQASVVEFGISATGCLGSAGHGAQLPARRILIRLARRARVTDCEPATLYRVNKSRAGELWHYSSLSSFPLFSLGRSSVFHSVIYPCPVTRVFDSFLPLFLFTPSHPFFHFRSFLSLWLINVNFRG